MHADRAGVVGREQLLGSAPCGLTGPYPCGLPQYCLNQNPSLDRYGQKPLPFDSL